MNNNKQHSLSEPYIIQVYPGNLETTLSSATWLNISSELRKMGWQVTLAVMGTPGKQMIGGIDVFGFSSPDVYILRNIIYHLKVVRFVLMNWSRINVIMFTQPSAPWFMPLLLLRPFMGAQFPLIVMDTRTVPMEDPRKASLKDRLRGWLYETMNIAANAWADGQTAITQRMAEKVHIPPERLWGVWPSGANMEEFVSASETRHWPIEGEPVVLTYIGILHYERNLMSLCYAVESALTEGMDFRLLLVGEGTEKKDLEKYASHTAGRIQVHSAVPHNEVPAVLSRVQVGVLPFPDEEKYRVSSPLKLFEYMASGLSILATKIACHTDVIGNGTHVFWAKDASSEGLLEALRVVWKERTSLSCMGKEATLAANDWTWAKSARKLSAALLPRLQTRFKIKQSQDLHISPQDK